MQEKTTAKEYFSMNLCLTVPRLNIGGAESYTCDLACRLAAQGHQVCVVSGGGHLVKVLETHGVRHFFWPMRLNYKLAALYLAHVVRREHAELIHANSNAAILASSMAAEHCGIPLVATCHGMFNKKELDRGIGSAAKLICVSNIMKQREIADTGIAPEKLEVIYNGIDCVRFNPARYAPAPHKGFRVGIVSRLRSTVFKGHADIMRGMAAEPPCAEPWILEIIGKGRSSGELKQLARSLGIADRVHFAGQETDMPRVLAELDAVVLATRYETFGLVLAEAMAMELPVVSYDSGGPAEIITDGDCGYLVPCGDYGKLAAAIEKLHADPAKAAAMGKRGRARVLALFNLDDMVEKVEQCYRQVLEGAKS